MRLNTYLTALLGVAARAASAPFNVSPLIAAGDDAAAFQLVQADFSRAAPFTLLGPPLPGFVLAQGDATAYDGNATFFAVLTPVAAGRPVYSNSTLFAFDTTTGAVRWSCVGRRARRRRRDRRGDRPPQSRAPTALPSRHHTGTTASPQTTRWAHSRGSPRGAASWVSAARSSLTSGCRATAASTSVRARARRTL